MKTVAGQSTLLLLLLVGKTAADDDVVRIDLGHASRDRHAVFDEDGMHLQVQLKVFLASVPHVAIEADLPEPGRFEAELAKPNELVELREVRVERQTGKADVVAAIKLFDHRDAERQAEASIDKLVDEVRARVTRQAGRAHEDDMRLYLAERRGTVPSAQKELKATYLRVRTNDATHATLAGKVRQLAEHRPGWYQDEIIKRTFNADVEALRSLYRDLLVPQIAEEYLEGLTFKPIVEADDFAEYTTRVKKRLAGVHLVLSGQMRDPQVAVKADDLLDASDAHRLRKAYFAEVLCRFFPETDPDDPNAQWFDGQRIASRATGIASIRVEGRLDPRRHDRVDWWNLERYDPVQVHVDWPRDAGFRIDPPYASRHGTLLRVVAVGERPVDYHFELRPADKHDGLNVVVHESSAKADARFPY
jgi:hypothetical protein